MEEFNSTGNKIGKKSCNILGVLIALLGSMFPTGTVTYTSPFPYAASVDGASSPFATAASKPSTGKRFGRLRF